VRLVMSAIRAHLATASIPSQRRREQHLTRP
jgi:hypothetical protein